MLQDVFVSGVPHLSRTANPIKAMKKQRTTPPPQVPDYTPPELSDDDVFTAYIAAVEPLVMKAGSRGIGTGDIHRRLGYANQRLTLAALAAIDGIEEYQCGSLRRWRKATDGVRSIPKKDWHNFMLLPTERRAGFRGPDYNAK
jgi:hypothetical protein